MVTSWLWIGAIGMAAGAILFFLMGLNGKREDQHHYLISFFIVLVAAANYLAMALHEAQTVVGAGRTFYYGRYTDWIITTPLLLLSLSQVAIPKISQRATLVASLILSDIFMIATGFVAGMSGPVDKYIWYLVSCGAFLAILGMIWSSLSREAARLNRKTSGLFYTLAGVLSVLWICYPIVFILGVEGLRVISPGLEALCYTVLDLCAKVGFGFILLTNLGKVRSPRPLPTEYREGGFEGAAR